MNQADLPAGIKLDRMVCERVLGFHSFKNYYNGGGHYLRPDGSQCGLFELPKPSRDIEAAFQVLNHFDCPRAIRFDGEKWWATFDISGKRYHAPGETAELAICRAALMVKEKQA